MRATLTSDRFVLFPILSNSGCVRNDSLETRAPRVPNACNSNNTTVQHHIANKIFKYFYQRMLTSTSMNALTHCDASKPFFTY